MKTFLMTSCYNFKVFTVYLNGSILKKELTLAAAFFFTYSDILNIVKAPLFKQSHLMEGFDKVKPF